MSRSRITRIPLAVFISAILIALPGVSPGIGTAEEAHANNYFLPFILVSWTPPCGGVPRLISPPDGSEIDQCARIILDGGYRGGYGRNKQA